MAENGSRIVSCSLPHDETIPGVPFHRYLMKRMMAYADQIALVDADTKTEWTFKNFLESIRHLSAALQVTYGLTKGQVVALALPNCPEFLISLLAVNRCGGVVALVNPGFTIGELEHVNKVCRPKFWICTPEISILLENSDCIVLEMSKNSADTTSQWHSIMNSVIPDHFIEPSFDVHQDLATLPFSSGTTGLPKAVMITHHNVTTFFVQSMSWFPRENGESDVTLGLMPMYHQYGWLFATGALSVGSRVITMPKFSLSGMLQAIQDYKINFTPLVPPIALMLSKLPLVEQYDLSSLKVIFVGAAPIGAEIIEKLRERCQCEVMQGYGLTEATLVVHATPRHQLRHTNKIGSVGMLMPFFEAKIVDKDTGKNLGAKDVGEILLRGPMVMKGYLGNPSATEETIDADGWLHTGDLGYYDEDGWFYITGRIKELIKYKGHQVSPSELEHIILKHPEVEDAAVVGMPDEMAGELPRAYVVKRNGSTVTEEQVANFLHGQISPYKYLRGGVVFVPSIPKSGTGKILRRKLNNLT